MTFSGNPEDPETCDVKKQNTLLCVVFKSKQHLMIHRVVWAIFVPLRLKGYLLFHLLPKRLPNTDLVAMSATYMRHYYQQWMSIILHVIAAFQDLHKVIFSYLQNTLLILLYLYKSGKVSVEVFIILNLIQFCAGKRCILCSHQNTKKPRVAPEIIIPM